MKIGILGSGTVGQTLAVGLKNAGHEVRIGTREPQKLADFSSQHGVGLGSTAEVVAFAEAVVLSVKGEIVEALAKELATALAGKVVLDATNPVAGAPVNGVVPYFTAANESLLERVQRAAPQAKVVKWMNSVGAPLMVKPALKGTPTMFICGNDADAKAIAAKLAGDLGWSAEDVGTAAMGHPVEALCQLWCAPGFLRNQWVHAFALLKP